MLDRDAPQTARDVDEGETVDDAVTRTARTATLEREIDRLEDELARKDARIEAIIRQYEGLLDEQRDEDREAHADRGTAPAPLDRLRTALSTLLS